MNIDDLQQYLSYDPETGNIAWIKASSIKSRIIIGQKAGCIDSYGYLVIVVSKRQYKAHRIAWALHHGFWPICQIDHINGIKTDNRIANLRDVSVAVNQQNQRRAQENNRSGLLGAHWHEKCRNWKSSITTNGKRVHLGYFKTSGEAHSAYMFAKQKHREGFALEKEGSQ